MSTTPKTDLERVQSMFARKVKQGKRRKQIWLSVANLEKLAALQARTCTSSRDQMVNDAIEYMARNEL